MMLNLKEVLNFSNDDHYWSKWIDDNDNSFPIDEFFISKEVNDDGKCNLWIDTHLSNDKWCNCNDCKLINEIWEQWYNCNDVTDIGNWIWHLFWNDISWKYISFR